MSQFARMPLEAIRDRRLSLIQTRVLMALKSFQNREGETVYPKREALAKLTGYTVENISKATSQLEQFGWLNKVSNGGRSKGAEYEITVPDLDTVSMPEKGGSSTTKRVSETETVSEVETVSESDSITVSEPDTLTVSDSDTPLKKEEQTMEQTREQTSSTASDVASMIATFAKLGFDVLQVRRPKVIGMLSQWSAEGVTHEDITALVQLKREESPDNPIASPMYFQGAMHDYLEAKRHEPEKTQHQPGRSGGRETRREHHARISEAADRLHAEAVAAELGDGTVSPVRGAVSR